VAQLNEVKQQKITVPVVYSLPHFRRTLVAVVAVAAGLILVAAYSYVSFGHLVERTVTRSNAVSALLLEVTEGHLWFEEIISGDTHEDIGTVWHHFESAASCGQVLLDGGDLGAGDVTALKDSDMRRDVEDVCQLLETFKLVAVQRYEHARESHPGSDIDQRFDRLFKQIIVKTKDFEAIQLAQSRQDLFSAKMVHWALVVLYVVLAVILISVLARYERKNTAAAALIREREAQLLQAQKLEAVGTLAGGIAHDFNNLLQAIIGYSEVLHDEPKVRQEYGLEVDSILKAANRAADLTRQLLAYSRRQVIDPVDLDVNVVLAEHLKMIRRLIGENIALQVVPSSEPVTISADQTQVEQILMNLCINARDAISGAGTITVESQGVTLEESYCADHVWAQPGRYALITISDTGAGMDQAIMDQIFEPFFTTKEVGKGSGLGLSTVYGIVQQNGGMINVYSELEHGTMFKVYWPIVDRPPMEEASLTVQDLPAGTETILLAEDDASVRNYVILLLERNGYTVLVAENGQEAIDIFTDQQTKIGLALLDVVMPIKSGREVLDYIRETGSEIPVVFASGYSLNAIHTDFVLHKGIVLLEKPYRRSQLLTTLAEALKPIR